jgi:hypothetical protein
MLWNLSVAGISQVSWITLYRKKEGKGSLNQFITLWQKIHVIWFGIGLTREPGWLKLIQLQFCSMAVDPPLTSWLNCYMSALDCLSVIHNFIFKFHYYYFISLIKVCTITLSMIAQLVVCLPTV